MYGTGNRYDHELLDNYILNQSVYVWNKLSKDLLTMTLTKYEMRRAAAHPSLLHNKDIAGITSFKPDTLL